MRASGLDRRIVIQRATTAPDAMNEPIQTWSKLASVLAAKEDIRDSERYSAGAVVAKITTRFRIRWSTTVADVSPTDRILFDGRVFDIVGTKEIGRREGVEITASARAERV
ncbi:phage head closure protein [Mongoliimonas terrestris]|uniref:phage head closure protein n=1 Tax=Mongoliimonas terrestris TaxID=1709001 RepID=UPI00094972A5|nr:phage head closure protein [Mongoliimonas terrestris]